MPRHAGGGVIQDDDSAGGLVIDHVHQRVDSRMHKGGIANHSHPAVDIILTLCLLHAMKGADAGAHADGGINDAKRRHCAQCIAANIPGRVYFQFVQHGVYACLLYTSRCV